MRELVWRAESLRRERWDHTALLALVIARGPRRGRTRLADFHPFLEAATENVESWDSWRVRAAGRLPERLSEAEIRERWKIWRSEK